MRRILFAALVVLCSGALGPQAQATTDENNPTELKDSIVVTANRFGQTEAKSVWPVAAIKSETIHRDISLPQLLDGRFGLDSRESGGLGSLSTVSNWGSFARHMLLLYNGRVVKDYSLGGFNLADFSSDEFERIELLKGPQSAFYGADAIGGVINLISKNSLIDRLEVTSRVGTTDLHQYRLDAAKPLGKFGVGGFAEFSAADNARPNSGSERKSFGVRSDFLSPHGQHRLSVSARYFADSVGTPGPVPDTAVPVYGSKESSSLKNNQKDENYSADVSYAYHSAALGDVQFDAFWEKKNLDYAWLYNYRPSYYTYDTLGPEPDSTLNKDSVDVHSLSVYNKRSSGVSGRIQRQLGKVTGSTGIDWLSGSLRAASDDKSLGTNVTGPFAPYSYSFRDHNFWSGQQNQFDVWGALSANPRPFLQLDMSGRLQMVRDRATQPSYDLGAAVSPAWNARLKVGYGYAFRLPSMSEQFANEAWVKGSPSLRPETSHSLVVTVEGEVPQKGLAARLSLFRQVTDSLIQYQSDPFTFFSVPRNVNTFKTTGVDFSLSLRLTAAHQVSWGAVVQRARQTVEKDSAGNQPLVDAFYVPDVKWRADLDGKILPRIGYNANLSFTSDRSILISGATKTIHQVYEIGASVSAKLSAYMQIALTGYDLTDQRRPDQFGFSLTDRDYPTPGRRFVLQVRAGIM